MKARKLLLFHEYSLKYFCYKKKRKTAVQSTTQLPGDGNSYLMTRKIDR